MGSIRIKSGRNSKKPKKSWKEGYGRGSELLIIIITITILWILITHTV